MVIILYFMVIKPTRPELVHQLSAQSNVPGNYGISCPAGVKIKFRGDMAKDIVNAFRTVRTWTP